MRNGTWEWNIKTRIWGIKKYGVWKCTDDETRKMEYWVWRGRGMDMKWKYMTRCHAHSRY